MTKGRRRKVITEKTTIIDQEVYSRNVFLMAPPMIEPLRKNRFSLILESDDGESIEPYKISGFNIENFNDKKAITITAILLIGDWIEKFKKMNTVKIFFLD